MTAGKGQQHINIQEKTCLYLCLEQFFLSTNAKLLVIMQKDNHRQAEWSKDVIHWFNQSDSQGW